MKDVQHEDEQEQEILLQLAVIETKLTDLKARWPYHSVQAKMVAEREDLEEERDRLLRQLNSSSSAN